MSEERLIEFDRNGVPIFAGANVPLADVVLPLVLGESDARMQERWPRLTRAQRDLARQLALVSDATADKSVGARPLVVSGEEGRPVFAGTDALVAGVVRRLTVGESAGQLRADHPDLTDEHLEFARIVGLAHAIGEGEASDLLEESASDIIDSQLRPEAKAWRSFEAELRRSPPERRPFLIGRAEAEVRGEREFQDMVDRREADEPSKTSQGLDQLSGTVEWHGDLEQSRREREFSSRHQEPSDSDLAEAWRRLGSEIEQWPEAERAGAVEYAREMVEALRCVSAPDFLDRLAPLEQEGTLTERTDDGGWILDTDDGIRLSVWSGGETTDNPRLRGGDRVRFVEIGGAAVIVDPNDGSGTMARIREARHELENDGQHGR